MTIDRLKIENATLKADLAASRGKLPPAKGLGENFLTVDQVAGRLGVTAREAMELVAAARLSFTKDQNYRDCLGERELDQVLLRRAGATGPPKSAPKVSNTL